jgi:hypothetical protein
VQAGAVPLKAGAAVVAPARPVADAKNASTAGKDKQVPPPTRPGSANIKSKQGPGPQGSDNKIPKIIIKQGGQTMAPIERRVVAPPALSAQQEAVTSEVRKGLWASVERWLAARWALGGDGHEKFKSEVKRLCQLLMFEEYKHTQEEDTECFDEQLRAERDNGSMSREVTYCRFAFRVPQNHPRPPPPLIFEATTHIFSADTVIGKTQRGLKGMRWKTEIELEGILSLSYNTQSMEVEEAIEADVLEQMKNTLNTELTVSELGVFLLIAGLCSRGVSAWGDVQDFCFWSHNFTLPEFQNAQKMN